MAKKKPRNPPWALSAAEAKNAFKNPRRATPLERARLDFMERFELLAHDPRLASLPDRALIRVQVVDPVEPERRSAFTVGLSDYDERGRPCFMMIVRGPRPDVLAAMLMFCNEEPEDAWAAHFRGHTMWVYEVHETYDISPDERDLVIGAPPSGRTATIGLLSGQFDVTAVNVRLDADAVARCSAVVDVLQRALAQGTLEAPPFGVDARLLELQPDGTGGLGPPIQFTPGERELLEDFDDADHRATLAELPAAVAEAFAQRASALPLLIGTRATLVAGWTAEGDDDLDPRMRFVDVALLDTGTLVERATEPIGRDFPLGGRLEKYLEVCEALLDGILRLFERTGGLPEHLTLELSLVEDMLADLVCRVRVPRPGELAPIVDVQSSSGPATALRHWISEDEPADPLHRIHHALSAALDWILCIGSRSVGVDVLAVSAFASAAGGAAPRFDEPDVEENAVAALSVLSATLDSEVVEPWFDGRAAYAPKRLERALAAWTECLPDLCVWSPASREGLPRFQSLLTGESDLQVRDLPESWEPRGGDALLVLCVELDGVQRREAPLPIARGQAEAWARSLGEATPEKRRAAALRWLRGALTV